MAVPGRVRDIKKNASNFVNDHKFVKVNFAWQESFGAFYFTHSSIGKVYHYILNQEHHHKKKNFKQECLELLKKFEPDSHRVEFEEKYLFEWHD